MKVLLTFIFSCLTFQMYCQVVKGNVVYQRSADIIFYDLICLQTADLKTNCDNQGHFTFRALSPIDTLVVTPIPTHLQVKIYNFPTEQDSISLDSIPLFDDVDRSIPIINFTSKRAARKFFKKLEQEHLKETEKLIKTIEETKFYWNNRRIPLVVRRTDEHLEVLINLKE